MTRRRLSPRVYLNPASVWELLDRCNMSRNKLALLSGISTGYQPAYMDDSMDDS